MHGHSIARSSIRRLLGLKHGERHADSPYSMRDSRYGKAAASEEGWALIEALMAAVVLVIVVLGVYTALDASSHTAGFNRQRTVASALAEQALEEMRGRDAASLADTNTPVTKSITTSDGKGTNVYDVVSSAKWVNDDTGLDPSCSDTSQNSYLKITAQVTPKKGPAIGVVPRTLTMNSLMAPSTQLAADSGTLAVKVLGPGGTPLAGAPVSITGAAVDSGSTNSVGCVVFPYTAAGTYSVQVPTTGYVDKGGVSFGATSATLTAGTTKLVTMNVAQQASLTVNVQTKNTSGTLVSDPSEGVVAANSGIPLGMRTFAPSPSGTLATSFSLTKLYPFSSPDGYAVYSGSCASADPAQYISNYYSANAGFVSLAPGASGGSITVLEPAMNLALKRNGTAQGSGMTVTIKALSGDCTDNPAYVYTGVGSGNTQLTSAGALTKPGLPFGHYSVCAYNSTSARHVTLTDVANTAIAGTAVQSLNITSSSPSGAC
jgi:Tfp pilus assembly protein PilV